MGGVILDSSVVIQAERGHWSVLMLLENIYEKTGEPNVGLTSIGVTELVHGIYRADSPERSEGRRAFLEAIVSDLQSSITPCRSLISRVESMESRR